MKRRRARPIAELPFDQAIAHANAIAELLAPFDVALSAKDRNRRLKMPSKSADAIVPILVIAQRAGLDAYTAPIEEHRSALAKLADLQLVLTTINSVTSGLVMSSESETWKATTTVYSMLRRIARSDAELAHLLQPVVLKYFARRKAPAPEAPAAVQAPLPTVKKTKKKKARRQA